MEQVVLLLGTNLGDKAKLLNLTIERIRHQIGEVSQQSHVYATPAWGFESDHEFYNQVVILHTRLAPENLLIELKKLELELGRDPLKKSTNGIYQDRLIDIDILFYGSQTFRSNQLDIPHPRLHLRKFTLVPLVEILPAFIHPVLEKSTQLLLNQCNDPINPTRVK